MATPYTVQWLLEKVLKRLEEKDTTLLADSNHPLYGADLLDDLNAQYALLTQQAQEYAAWPLLYFDNVESANGLVTDYRLSPGRGRLVGLFRRGSASTVPAPGEMEVIASYASQRNGVGNQDMPAWSTDAAGRIFLLTSTHNYWRAWWLRDPQPLVSGTVTSWTAGTKALVVDAEVDYGGALAGEDDAYRNDLVMVNGTVCRVTAWDAATRTFTLENPKNPSADVFSSAPGAEDEWSLLPWFPSTYMELLVLMTVEAQGQYDFFSQRYMREKERWQQHFSTWVCRPDQASLLQTGVSPGVSSLLEPGFGGTRYTDWVE